MQKQTTRSLTPILLGASLIPLLLLLAQEGSRFIGVALLGVFAYFVYYTFKSRHDETDKKKEHGSPYKPLLFFMIGISILIVSAKIIVDSASSIAEYTGIAESALGATIISIGTTIPELSVNIVAVRKRHLDLAIGNTVGSCLTNISLVLGIVLVLSEVAVNFAILSTLIAFAIAAPAVLYVLLRKGVVEKWHALALFAIYVVFLLVIYEVEIIIGDIRLV
jgi:cation:H+ antiporter